MPLPTIDAAEPTIIPEVIIPAKTYDKFWMATLVINASDPNGIASAGIELIKYRDLDDGTKEVSQEPSIQVKLDNLTQLLGTDPDLGPVVFGLLNYVIKVTKQQGLAK